jgi:hypothetical protein
MIISIVINLVALVSLIVAIFMVTGCYITDKSVNDPAFSERFLDASLKDMLSSCVFPDATGSVKGFVKDINRFDTLTDMTKTFG